MPLSFSTQIILSILSGGILIEAFPCFDINIVAWFALIPLMFAIDSSSSLKRSFWLSYIAGYVFFLGTLYWLFNVTIVGAILLISYFACYWAIFGLCYHKLNKLSIWWKIITLPSLWVVLEFIKAHLFTGLDWASLGQSQYQNLAIIQIADIVGMKGISFLIVMINIGLKEFYCALINKKKLSFNNETFNVPVVLLLVYLIVFFYGQWRLEGANCKNSAQQMKVAIIQANIPQHMKWRMMDWPTILAKHQELTKDAIKSDPDIDLIIWPETSFPGIWGEDDVWVDKLLEFVQQMPVPILIGAVVNEDEKYYNSAVLLDGSLDKFQRYDKMHLVPFGEYVPFGKSLPFLKEIIPVEDFTPGSVPYLFNLEKNKDNANKRFAALVCFEDTVSELTSLFVRQGAKLLINITNDAWFKDTNAPFMHLQAAVFRTIENRRTLIRAANTGVSCIIDSYGRIRDYVKDNNKKTYISGYSIAEVSFMDEETVFSHYGNWFINICLIFGIVGFCLSKRKG